MGLKIIKEREVKNSIVYSLNFDYKEDSNSGFSFPCDKNGYILRSEMTQTAIDNYHKCLKNINLTLPYVTSRKIRWVEPAVGKCYCGHEVILENQYMGACQCSRCGQWYNVFGQTLLSPELWEDEEY